VAGIECPAIPSSVKAVPGDNQVTISWAAPDPTTASIALPTAYRVRVLPGATTHTAVGTATSLTVTDLRNGVRYGFTVTAVNDAGASAPSAAVEATPSSAVEGEVERLIVAYEPGVRITEAPGVATGSSTVDDVALSPGAALGTGMRTVTLSEAVDDATAERIADELTADPRVKWAEPDFFVPLLQDGISPEGLPQKSGPMRAANAVQSTKSTSSAMAQGNSPDVGSQTACTASSNVEPIARCFDDNDFDAGASIDGEIIWSDAYVTAGSRSRLLVDAVPWAQIRDPYWLLYSDTYLMACFDTTGDGASETCVIPQWAALNANQSTGVSIYDRIGGTWTPRGSTCTGTTTRRAGDHAAIAGSSNSWWQFDLDWSCLFGANTSSVRVMSFLRDYLYPAGDYSPDAYAGLPMNFTSMTNATPPSAPTSVGLSPTSGGLSVTWSAPASDGGAPITGYSARAFTAATGGTQVGSCTATSGSCVMSQLPSTSAVWVDVIASNAVGASPASSPRVAGTPGAAGLPGSPTAISVSPASTALTVRWSAPTWDGGSSITAYEARAYPQAAGGAAIGTCTTAAAQCTIAGLINGQAYWIEVNARNAVGSGPATTPRVQATPAVGFTPTDPYYTNGSMWGLNGTFGVQAPDAWMTTRGSASTVVAVLDTGSTVHPDLDGTTLPGYDMISDPAVAVDGNGRDSDPTDAGDASGGYSSSWHGTHVAGTINAVASNGIGVVGVAPDVKVQHVRVLGAGGGYTSDILVGITWASGGSVPGIPANPTPAKVINMSLGGYGACSPDWQSKIDDAVARGTTVVVAAGNSNANASGFSPASCARTVTVAAIASSGKRASFSNYGSTVEVAAPGVGIWSTLNSGSTSPGAPSYASYSGTSMAAPHVAGVVALMVSREPGLTPAQVSTRLTTPSLLTPFPGGACDASATATCGAGIANAGRLLAVASSPSVTVPGAPTAVSGTSVAGQVVVSWSSPSSNGGSAITGYTARAYSVATGGTAAGSCTTTSLMCTITGLSSTATYHLEVTASNAVGAGPASAPRAAIAPTTVPGAPTGVTATAGVASASVTWIAPGTSGGSAITGYTARAFAAASGGSPIATCTATSTACSLTGLANGTTVHVDVVATNAVGASSPSSPRVPVTARTVPGSPRSVVVTPGNGTLAVSWTQPASNGGSPITGFTAAAYDSATGGSLLGQCTSITTGCSIGSLANGVAAHVEVTATNVAGTSVPSSPRVAGTPRTTPAPATAVTLVPGSRQLTVSWSAPANVGGLAISSYTARAFLAATGGVPIAACTSASTSCVIGGLANGTAYHVEVVATNGAGSGPPSSPRVSAVPRSAPTAPLAVLALPGDSQATVTWRTPSSNGGSPITGFTARAFAASTGGSPLATCTVTALTCTLTALTNGSTVFVDVVAANAAGDGPASMPRVAVTPRTTPGSPANVSAQAGAGQVAVTWVAPTSSGGSRVTGYQARAYGSASGGSPVGSCATTGATTCVIRGLANGTTYFMEVVGINVAGPGLASTPRVSATPATVPSAVGPISVTAGNASATIAWQTPAFDGGSAITGYLTRAWSAPAGGAILATCTSTTTTCSLTGLANGVNYHVDVLAINGVGNGAAPARRVAVLPRTVASAPTSVQARFGNGRLDVAWVPPVSNGGSAVTGYVARAFAEATSSAPVATCATAARACTISGLVNGTPYLVEVVALNAVGSSIPSPRLTETPRAIPGAPSAVLVTAGPSNLTVSWTPPAVVGGTPVTSFTARAFLVAGGGSPVASCTAIQPTCVIPQLSNGRQYFVDVIATNAVGNGPASPPRVTGVPRTIPTEPVRVQATPGNGQLLASWRPPSSNGGASISGYTARAMSAGKEIGFCTTTGLGCAITGLVNGTPYTVEVVASNVAGTGMVGAPATATPRTVPGAPRQVQATSSVRSLVISWAAPEGNGGSPVTGYTVRAWTAAAGGAAVQSCSTAGALTCTVPRLADGATYFIDVTASNAAGSGPASGARVAASTQPRSR